LSFRMNVKTGLAVIGLMGILTVAVGAKEKAKEAPPATPAVDDPCGVRKMTKKVDKPLLEAHILDFGCNIYGQEITVEIGNKIRDSIKFDNEKELIQQITKDIQTIRRYFLTS